MIALVASVILGGLFGAASATVESIDADVMTVNIEVEVSASGGTVVAHLSFSEEEVLTLPLLDRGEGTYGIRTELEAKNYVVVFEAIGDEPESTEPVTLTQMGADLGPQPGAGTTLPEDGLSPESRRSLWLAVALGAASLSVLAFWVLGGRRGDEDDDAGPTASGEEE